MKSLLFTALAFGAIACGQQTTTQTRTTQEAAVPVGTQSNEITGDSESASEGGSELRYAAPKQPRLCKDIARIRPNPGSETGAVWECSYTVSPCKAASPSEVSCLAIAQIVSATGSSQSVAKYNLAVELCSQPELWSQLPRSYSSFRPNCAQIAAP